MVDPSDWSDLSDESDMGFRSVRVKVRVIAAVLVAALLVAPAFAAIPRILMVGDSWPWFMMLNQAFTTALDEAGLGQYEAVGMYTTAPGSTPPDASCTTPWSSAVLG